MGGKRRNDRPRVWGVSFQRMSQWPGPRWLHVWPCLAGAEFFSSAPHTNPGKTSSTQRRSYWQSATGTLLGHRTEASLKWRQEFPEKCPPVHGRDSQGVKLPQGLKAANAGWRKPWCEHFTEKEWGARSRTTEDSRACFPHLSWCPSVTTLLLLENPWRQAAKSHKQLSYPGWYRKGEWGHPF